MAGNGRFRCDVKPTNNIVYNHENQQITEEVQMKLTPQDMQTDR